MNIVLQAGLESISTRIDGSLKLTYSTPELSAEKCGELFKYRRKEVLILMSTGKHITTEQTKAMNNAASDLKQLKGKSHSQRLREALYLLHDNERSMLDFKEYYAQRMQALIDSVLERLDNA